MFSILFLSMNLCDDKLPCYLIRRAEKILSIVKWKSLFLTRGQFTKTNIIIHFPIVQTSFISNFTWKSHKKHSLFFADPLVIQIIWPPPASIIASMTFCWIKRFVLNFLLAEILKRELCIVHEAVHSLPRSFSFIERVT